MFCYRIMELSLGHGLWELHDALKHVTRELEGQQLELAHMCYSLVTNLSCLRRGGTYPEGSMILFIKWIYVPCSNIYAVLLFWVA